jgi:rubrerythrin
MKTSKQWWDSVKNNENELVSWLIKQWRGEVTAAMRIVRFAEQYAKTNHQIKVLNAIAAQEEMHADWVKELLVSRNINVDSSQIEQAEQRYWRETLPNIVDFETGSAVAAHAEKMRLERIRVIAADETAPEDIRTTFAKILTDEEWHERAFRELSSIEALESTKNSHQAGMETLGLEA